MNKVEKTVVEISWEEFLKHQAKQDFWLLIDGRIYDVTSWINKNPETGIIPHPGGSIPLQAMKRDGTYLFEIYHSTNESYKV
jgi:cytochrome b involved in lipid metabolism